MKATPAAALGALALLTGTASAEDALKLAIGQRGNWDTSVSRSASAPASSRSTASRSTSSTQGAGETQQAVISGSVDLGVAAGVMGVLSAFSKARRCA